MSGTDGKNPTYRKFPGPPGATAALRISFDKTAYADLIFHSKSSLEDEVCGVLVGHVHTDQTGEFTQIYAIIEGERVEQGSTHVTFTQETWNEIHLVLENEYPNMQILGWYHTHPGFGTAYSDMDMFIQENFFPLPTQVGMVLDPLSTDVSIYINIDREITSIDRFWVNEREIRCNSSASQVSGNGGDLHPMVENLQQMENRLNQFIQEAVDRRNRNYRMVMSFLVSILIVFLGWFGYGMYQSYIGIGKNKPKAMQAIQNFGSVPITIPLDDKTVLLEVNFRGMVVQRDAGDKETTESDDRQTNGRNESAIPDNQSAEEQQETTVFEDQQSNAQPKASVSEDQHASEQQEETAPQDPQAHEQPVNPPETTGSEQ